MNKWKSLQLLSGSVSCMLLGTLLGRFYDYFMNKLNTDVDLVNTGDTPYEITVTPSQCCLFIEENDIDCEVCCSLAVRKNHGQRIKDNLYREGSLVGSCMKFKRKDLYMCVCCTAIRLRLQYCAHRSLLQTLELKPPSVLLLGSVEEEYSGNNSGRALFLFRNLVSNDANIYRPCVYLP